MLAKRIVPCLDIADGRVVKGVHFLNLNDVGDPVELAMYYDAQGADEIVFLDISATYEGRQTMLLVIERAAKVLSIPLTVGGGVRSLQDIREILRAGADKVAINSAALQNPQLIHEASRAFGAQCIVGAVDAKYNQQRNAYDVYRCGGRENTGRDLVSWVQLLEEYGAGEVLLTSMDADGTTNGYDLAMLSVVCDAVRLPIVASGGCGSSEDIAMMFLQTSCDAALAASIFHYKTCTITDVKRVLAQENIPIRPIDLLEVNVYE